MGKNLVIVESPSKGKTIEKFLGPDYKVVASMGHIRDLPPKAIGVDLEKDFTPTYEISQEKKKTVDNLKKLAASSGTVWIATDEDREGEAIGWHLCHALGLDPKVTNRIVFHEITKKAITESIKTPRKIDINLVDAQQARRVLDRIVGYKVSPVLWKKIRKGLSAGRVQSVAVKLIVEKEKQIKEFKPQESWNIFVELTHGKQAFKVALSKIGGKVKKIKSEAEVQKLMAVLFGDFDNLKREIKKKGDKEFVVISKTGKIVFELKDSTKKELKRKPQPPFTTSTLQQEGSRKFGFGVKQTMMLAQKLYEGVDLGNGEREGLITYMRTDSVHLSDLAKGQAKEVIESKYGKEYFAARDFKTKSAGAQEAHEAIRPVSLLRTPESLSGSSLTAQELKLYSLIFKRTLASQMKDALVELTTFTFSPETAQTQSWVTKGEVIKFEGFMKVYTESTDDEEEDNENESILPNIKIGEKLDAKELLANQTFTRPPARYTEASLVKKLEAEGIGRPSTYAPTIGTIISRGYVEKDKKHLFPTEVAFVVTDFLEKYFAKMMDYKFTSKVEEDFDKIAKDEETYKEMLTNFYGDFKKDLENAGANAEKIVEKTGRKCPECKNELFIKYGKNGKFVACSNYPECKYTEELEEEKKKREEMESKYKDKKCINCGSPMAVKNGRFGQFLGCTNYPKCKTIEEIKDPKTELIEKFCEQMGFLTDESGAELVVKNSKRGLFLAAKDYPKVKIAKPIPKDVWAKVNEEIEKQKEESEKED